MRPQPQRHESMSAPQSSSSETGRGLAPLHFISTAVLSVFYVRVPRSILFCFSFSSYFITRIRVRTHQTLWASLKELSKEGRAQEHSDGIAGFTFGAVCTLGLERKVKKIRGRVRDAWTVKPPALIEHSSL